MEREPRDLTNLGGIGETPYYRKPQKDTKDVDKVVTIAERIVNIINTVIGWFSTNKEITKRKTKQ